MSSVMSGMEHPESTISVPPIVEQRVLLQFCNAVQQYAMTAGCEAESAIALRSLRARIDNLRGLASLCRLAISGHPQSFARVVDELECLSVDFSSDPLKDSDREHEVNEDEPDTRVQLAAAIDLFAGASFVSRNRPAQRNRFIIGIVRALEAAIAFPVTFSAEASNYLGITTTQLPLHAKLVIANATQRLIDRDNNCVPRAPAEIRSRLECLARQWMKNNPVDEFFAVIAGPEILRIVHWEDPARSQSDDARVGDPVTLLLRAPQDDMCSRLDTLAVMFCPHQPAPLVRVIDDGLQVLVPENARTGPIAVIRSAPDFSTVKALLKDFSCQFQPEWTFSIFSSLRMDLWAFPVAFGPPILEILSQANPGQGPNPAPMPAGQPGVKTSTPNAVVGRRS